jgi:AcrR family transcriptional regulator
MSAEERREAVTAIALRHFAEGGFAGTSTEAIAAEAGVSQPYLFRLFGTKKELFLAAAEAMTARVVEAFERAAEGVEPDQRLSAMGLGYMALLKDRTMLRMQLQTHAAAAGDPEIQVRARRNYETVIATIRRVAGVEGVPLVRFMATGMFLNVLAALDFEGVDGVEAFTERWCDPVELVG